jgi:hypothetical protein
VVGGLLLVILFMGKLIFCCPQQTLLKKGNTIIHQVAWTRENKKFTSLGTFAMAEIE